MVPNATKSGRPCMLLATHGHGRHASRRSDPDFNLLGRMHSPLVPPSCPPTPSPPPPSPPLPPPTACFPPPPQNPPLFLCPPPPTPPAPPVPPIRVTKSACNVLGLCTSLPRRSVLDHHICVRIGCGLVHFPLAPAGAIGEEHGGMGICLSVSCGPSCSGSTRRTRTKERLGHLGFQRFL